MTPSTCPQIGLSTRVEPLDRIYGLAVDTLMLNIKPFRDGLLDAEAPVIMAGETYQTPWTRDCAFNVWNAGGLLVPEPARNTLLSTLMRDGDVVRVGGQYWDAIAWVTGAWAYYSHTCDAEFLPLAFDATVNSLNYFERTEFDAETGLFEGAASYGDGVAAYPEPYNQAGGSSGILDWPAAHPDVGKIRMKALSTNCLYYNAYRIAALMGERLGSPDAKVRGFRKKADDLRDAINRHLWLPELGRYAYFIDHQSRCEDYMEGLGHAFALLFGVADDEQSKQVLTHQHVTEFGIPCVWPVFPRFRSEDGMDFGRHCGTIWPFIQGFWATAAAERGNLAVFERELLALAAMADRHHEFKEIYHPVTGEPYGGLQIDKGQMRVWASEPHQTWSATGYLCMIHRGLLGMRIEPETVSFAPRVPARFETIRLGPVPCGTARLDIAIQGHGKRVRSFTLDGQPHEPSVPRDRLTGTHTIEIAMS